MCLNPQCRKIRTTTGTYKMLHYNCGYCIECVKALQRDWSTRISAECRNWPTRLFVTLKLSQERVPHADVILTQEELDYLGKRYACLPLAYHYRYINDPNYDYGRISSAIPLGNDLYLMDSLTFDKDALQRFYKRVRKALGAYRLKYFVGAEYGPKTLRPHYHGIFMSDAPVEVLSSIIYNEWSKVACYDDRLARRCIDIQPVRNSDAAAKYVSKYCVKPAEFEHPLVVLRKIPKPFRMMSKGLGIDVANELRDKYNDLLKQYNIKPQVITKDGNVRHINDASYLQCYRLNDDFYADLQGIFVQNRKVGDKICRIPVPRYWRDRCMPVKVYWRVVYDDNGQGKTICSTVKDGDHPISAGYASYINRQISDEYNERYNSLHNLNPDLSDEDIVSILADEDRRDMQRRYKDAVDKLHKVYSKAQL